MQKIQMVDLISQYDKIQPEIDKAVLDVIRSSAYINGPEVKSFAAELEGYLGVKHVIPCANGTDALQISMMALGFKPGDEVVVTGCGTSETMWGGYSELARLDAKYIVPRPQSMTLAPALT